MPVLRRSFTLTADDRALIVEDVVTTGLFGERGDRRRAPPRRASRRHRRRRDARTAAEFGRADARPARSCRSSRTTPGGVRSARPASRSTIPDPAARERDGAAAGRADDRAFVEDLGRRTVMASSAASFRRAPELAVHVALERLIEIVEQQSHVTLIAESDGERAGFVLLLDDLPDEVTALPQGFVAYMAVEPAFRRRGIGRRAARRGRR